MAQAFSEIILHFSHMSVRGYSGMGGEQKDSAKKLRLKCQSSGLFNSASATNKKVVKWQEVWCRNGEGVYLTNSS